MVPLCAIRGLKLKIENLLKIDDELTLVRGELEREIEGISNIGSFSPSNIIFLGKSKLVKNYQSSQSFDGSEVIVTTNALLEDIDCLDADKKLTVLTTKNFPITMCKISKVFYDKKLLDLNYQVDGRKLSSTNIHPSTVVSENVFIGENVEIGENCIIMSGVSLLENVTIADHTILYPNVVCMPFTKIGSHTRIHANTTIGSDGFGYNYHEGVHHKIWHMGGVIIGDHVEIGANCTIDQGTFSPTMIGDGSKFDNMVHIAHNVDIEAGVILCGQVGVAGSSKVGAFTVVGGKAGIGDGISVGRGAQVGGAAMVINSIEDGAKVGGHPARPLNEWMKGLAFVRRESLKKK